MSSALPPSFLPSLSPSLIHPSNLLHVAPLCAPVIRCNEKCFQNGSHLPCDANWACAWYSHERRGGCSSLTVEGAEERGNRKEEDLFFQPRVDGGEQKIKVTRACINRATRTALPPQRHKVMRGNTIFISCHLQGITTMPPRGCYWSRWERAARATSGRKRRNFANREVFGLHSFRSRGTPLQGTLPSLSEWGTMKEKLAQFRQENTNKTGWEIDRHCKWEIDRHCKWVL